MNLFDAHCHLEDEKFDEDRASAMKRMAEAGVRRCILAGSDFETSRRIAAMAAEYEGIYGVVGVHPHEAAVWNEESESELTQLSAMPGIVGIGEIGLDYYYDLDFKDLQKQVFVNQLELAAKLDLPTVFHIRDAHGDVLEILRARRGRLPRGVVHCFSGSVETAREYLNLGYYISFAGPVTFKNASRLLEVARFVPEDRFMVETDSPYMAPVPMRGKRNEPAFVAFVAEKIAELRGISPEQAAETAARNTCRLYGIPFEKGESE